MPGTVRAILAIPLSGNPIHPADMAPYQVTFAEGNTMLKSYPARFGATWLLARAAFALALAVSFQGAHAATHWGTFSEKQCSGTVRTYFSRLWDVTGSNGMAQCQSTALTVDGASFPGAHRCIDKGLAGLWGEVDVPDARCGPLTFQGTARFSETELLPTPRGMSFADIEVWACGNRAGSACAWGKVSTGRTDAAGAFSLVVPGPRSTTDLYQVRLIARNAAAIVWQQDTASTFWTDLKSSSVKATRDSSVLDFSRTFGITGHELFVSRHLNAAQKLVPAREFVLKFRDKTESDALGRVIVGPSLATGTPFTNSGVIRINPTRMLDEDALVHEYGHFVQESIGAYYLWPSVHTGCWVGSATSPENSPEFAWFEGFPEFLSRAVRLYSAPEYSSRSSPLRQPHSPSDCSVIGMNNTAGALIGPDAVENRVIDALQLLMGDSRLPFQCPQLPSTAEYRACVAPIWDANLALIMAIMDKELDFSQPNPVNVNSFYRAWLARGGNRAHVDAAMAATGIGTAPVPAPKTPREICLEESAKAQAECMASANTGLERSACVREAKGRRDECQALPN